MEPVGRWYVLMNNGVHSIMYPYLALKVGAFLIIFLIFRRYSALMERHLIF